MRLNNPVLGFLLGLFLPVLSFFIISLALHTGANPGVFIDNLLSNHSNGSKVIALSLIGNGLMVMYLNSRRKLGRGFTGFFIATMLYAALCLVLYFF